MITGKVYKLRHPTWFYFNLIGQTIWEHEHLILIEEYESATLLRFKFLSSKGLCSITFNDRLIALRDFPITFEEP